MKPVNSLAGTARRLGFTLIELLTVIAIIGILSAILIPAAVSARVAARNAATKVLFAKWTLAVEHYRQEYGFYPRIADDTGRLDPARFSAALTGRTLDGSVIENVTELEGNTRAIAFCAFSEGELDDARRHLVDAFGNDDIAVLIDRDANGLITAADGETRAVTSARTGLSVKPEEGLLVPGVRRGVIFYSAGNGRDEMDIVYSWK
jgi:prepilin-type N-terminal cleavage/methylation domain-containing protein